MINPYEKNLKKEVDEIIRISLIKFAIEYNNKKMFEELKNNQYKLYKNKEREVSRNLYGHLYVVNENKKAMTIDWRKLKIYIKENEEKIKYVEVGIKERWNTSKDIIWSEAIKKNNKNGYNEIHNANYETIIGTPIAKVTLKSGETIFLEFHKHI